MNVLQLTAGVLLVAGSALAVLTGLGLLRLPDVLSRLQAATKLQLPGLGLILVAAALTAESPGERTTLLLVLIFQAVTVPVLGQIVGRAAYRAGEIRSDLSTRDSTRDAATDRSRARSSSGDGVSHHHTDDA